MFGHSVTGGIDVDGNKYSGKTLSFLSIGNRMKARAFRGLEAR